MSRLTLILAATALTGLAACVPEGGTGTDTPRPAPDAPRVVVPVDKASIAGKGPVVVDGSHLDPAARTTGNGAQVILPPPATTIPGGNQPVVVMP